MVLEYAAYLHRLHVWDKLIMIINEMNSYISYWNRITTGKTSAKISRYLGSVQNGENSITTQHLSHCQEYWSTLSYLEIPALEGSWPYSSTTYSIQTRYSTIYSALYNIPRFIGFFGKVRVCTIRIYSQTGFILYNYFDYHNSTTCCW